MLPPRHARVVAERFCLSGPDQPTLKVLGEALGVSRERIRQIHNKGVRRLRSPARRAVIEETVAAAAGDVLQNN
ncbi:MAG: sigma factor-like helix-turn-helix DNA-binding protein [Candidatus Sulfomarinibacteraceae bacterium]